MNKKIGIAIGTVVVAAVAGLGIYQSEAAPANPTLSSEEIRELVESQYAGQITEMEIDKEFNKVVYEVEVQGDGKEYEVKLDGDTGEVLKEKQKEDFDDDRSEDTVKKTLAENEDIISAEEAKEIALKEFDGTVTKIELDEDDGRFVYEIEVKNNNKEADFKIDAVTGDIYEQDIDTENDDDDNDD